MIDEGRSIPDSINNTEESVLLMNRANLNLPN
jgi:hypothetical protein